MMKNSSEEASKQESRKPSVDPEEAKRRASERVRNNKASQAKNIPPEIPKPVRAVPNRKKKTDPMDVVQACGFTLRQIRAMQDRELSPED